MSTINGITPVEEYSKINPQLQPKKTSASHIFWNGYQQEKSGNPEDTGGITIKKTEGFHVDLGSKYQALSEKDKGKYIIDEFGKLFGDDAEWAALNDSERKKFLNEKIVNYLKENEPEKYEELKSKDISLKMQEEFLTRFEVALSSADGETNIDKIMHNYRDLSSEDKIQKQYEYIVKLDANGEELNDYQQTVLDRGNFEKDARLYAEENGLKFDNKARFEYLQSKADKNGELSEYERKEYDAMKAVIDKFGGILSDNSEKRVTLAEKMSVESSGTGEVDTENPNNLKSYLEENLKNKNQEECKEWLKQFSCDLDFNGLKVLVTTLKDMEAGYLDSLMLESKELTQVAGAALVNGENPDEKLLDSINTAAVGHIENSEEGSNEEAVLINISKSMINTSNDAERQSSMTAGLAETNHKLAVGTAAEVAYVNGIEALVDSKLDKSEKAAPETRSLYARTGVELQPDDKSKLERTRALNEFGNADFTKGTVEALASYSTDEARNEADKIITETVENKLDEEGRRLVTRTRMDVMSKFSADLQKQMYERTMQSKHDDVLETGAQNIYKLDESIRDYAVDLTKSLGKENVTNAIKTEAGAASSAQTQGANSSESGYQTGTLKSGAVYGLNTSVSDPAKEVYKSLSDKSLSTAEKIEGFKNLSRKEQKEVLKYLSKQRLGDLPVEVCNSFSELIPTFVAQGRGIEIIRNCSTSTANMAIRNMKKGDDDIKKELQEFIAANPALFTQISVDWANKQLGIDDNKSGRHVRSRQLALKA